MGRLIKLLLLTALLVILLSPLAIYFLILNDNPIALQTDNLQPKDLVRVQRMLAQQVGRPDAEGRVSVSLGEKDLATAFAFARQTAKSPLLDGARLQLEDDHLLLRGNLQLPIGISRNVISYQARLEADGKQPHITKLRLGYVPVPASLLRWLEERAMHTLQTDERLSSYRKTWDSVEAVKIADQQLSVVYRITPAVIESMAIQQKKLLLEQIDFKKVARYSALLEGISQKTRAERYPLTAMLAPAYDLARTRSLAGRDAVEENSAALIALSIYTADPQVMQMIGLNEHIAMPSRKLTLTLHRREDLAKHFLTAALISLFAGDQVADLIGMQKELDDSQSSSGFGLADLVADKAGIRFAALATGNESSARKLQEQLSHLLYDDELLPSPDDLPQMDIENELARLDERNLDAYLEKIDGTINQLLARIPLYRL
jgi:hypothetical protein